AFETLPREVIYRRTGIQFLPFNTLYQLLADRADTPDLLRRTHTHLLIADYFNHRFGGCPANDRPVIERTMASTTQLVDVRSGEWSEALFDAFGLDRSAWPEIVEAGTRLGPASEAPGVEVVASCSHDTGAAVAAA